MKPVDGRQVPRGQLIETEICIVGGGAAGLTVARELAGCDFRVCLLESGGLHEEEASQALSSGKTIGNYQIKLSRRQRQYGGTANRWLVEIGDGELGVRYAPLDEIDFERRDWLPYSGWPFSKDHVDPFYARAHKVCGIGPYSYEPEDWEDSQHPPLPLPESGVVTKLFQFGRRKVFTREIPDSLERAANITAYLHANVIEIETDDVGQTATRLKVACLGGNEFHVAAKYFVLAAGGIECARLLLLSDRVQPRGLGNQNDLVGRFFMVHPQFHNDRFTPASSALFSRARLYDLRPVHRAIIMGRLGLSRDVMEREHLLNIGAMLLPREQKRHSLGPFVKADGTLTAAPRSHQYLNIFKTRLADLLTKMRAPAPNTSRPLTLESGGWSQFADVEARYATFKMASLVEQAPEPTNRVMLGLERDLLGARRLEVHWRWSESDNLAVLRARARIGQELVKAGLGTFELKNAAPKNADSSHHMGTTRMHADARQGVVDADCKLHGVANLFVASSAVFPTGGFANPTLTIVALSIRLADHLKTQLSGR